MGRSIKGKHFLDNSLVGQVIQRLLNYQKGLSQKKKKKKNQHTEWPSKRISVRAAVMAQRK